MTDVPDARLLEQFARNGSEEAFGALVQRHIALVHSVALRHTANAQHAQDITQAVFVILARKAGTLGRRTVLPGWLYHTARLTAANLQRAETSRIRREQEAFMQSQLEESVNDALWRELSPQLDEAMAGLGASERDALVLRYFQNKSMAEVGKFLGLAENTAQKRVSRALEKLRKFFTKRGVSSTTAILAGAISANSVQAVPATLAKSVTAVALAKGLTASTSTLTLIKGALKIMAWTKAKTAIVTGAILVAAVGTTTITLNEFAFRKPASHPDASSPGGLNETNPVEYYILHTPLLQNNEQLRSDLVGTWKLTGAKSLKTGKFVVLAPENRFYKTFTLTDWSTVSYDSNSNLLNSAGGPYTINGELCKETIATATGEKSQFLGARVPFRIRVTGDDYYQMGSGSHPSVEQQWHRVRD
jgi:RNA polymerase sigma factor (sigma-70 family)